MEEKRALDLVVKTIKTWNLPETCKYNIVKQSIGDVCKFRVAFSFPSATVPVAKNVLKAAFYCRMEHGKEVLSFSYDHYRQHHTPNSMQCENAQKLLMRILEDQKAVKATFGNKILA